MPDLKLTTDPSELASLPSSDRLHVLREVGLIRKWEEGDNADGVHVDEGEIVPNNSKGWKTPFPSHLLSAEGELGKDAKAVLLSNNRILLDGEMPVSLAFLQSMGDSALSQIRKLDIWFSEPQISEWKDNPPDTNAVGWRRLATFVADKLNLATLELSLDAGQAHETYREMQAKEKDLAEAQEVYEDIIRILVEVLGGRKPKSFEVFWAVFHDHEAKAERAVMGDNYDSAKLGKVPASKRNPFFPHGVPTEKYEWKNGMAL